MGLCFRGVLSLPRSQLQLLAFRSDDMVTVCLLPNRQRRRVSRPIFCQRPNVQNRQHGGVPILGFPLCHRHQSTENVHTIVSAPAGANSQTLVCAKLAPPKVCKALVQSLRLLVVNRYTCFSSEFLLRQLNAGLVFRRADPVLAIRSHDVKWIVGTSA